MATTEPKSIRRVNSGSVIVYDLSVHTITTQKAKNFKNQEAKLYTAPRFGNQFDIYDESRLIATLDLGKLGWGATTKRWFGKCNQVLVV